MTLVDARFINNSGIGRHIAGVLGAWPSSAGAVIVDSLQCVPPGWKSIICKAKMYSLSEQGYKLRQLSHNADVTWFPHYAHPYRCSGRWVCTVHDVIHLAMPELFPGLIRRWAARALLHDVRDHATGICFVSQFSRDEFIRLLGKPKGKMYIVGNGVNADWTQPVAPPREWNGKPYIVAVGNVKAHKGLTYLLRAMQSSQLAQFDLVLIGQADGLRNVDHKALLLVDSLGERCRWTGQLDDSTLRSWVGHACVLAFPSLYEGFGLPPLEAMAAGIPVVASHIPAVAETCGDAAMLVEPKNTEALVSGLHVVISDKELRTRMIAKGKQCAAQWTWTNTAQVTYRALCDAMNPK